MISRDELTSTIEKIIGQELLIKARTKDIYANGVQLRGSKEVNKIALGVTATYDFFVEAEQVGAQYCLFHHGLDLTNHNVVASRFHPGTERVLRYVFDKQMTVAGYHYSLDAHPEIGNNAVIIRELGAMMTGEPYYDEWGHVAQFKKAINKEELAAKLSDITAHDVFSIFGGPDMVKRIGVCSGGAKPYDTTMWEIIDKKIDAHIAGEVIEASAEQATGIGYNYLSAGHYATEVFGVQELGKKLKSKFGDKLEVEFVDIPNPL